MDSSNLPALPSLRLSSFHSSAPLALSPIHARPAVLFSTLRHLHTLLLDSFFLCHGDHGSGRIMSGQLLDLESRKRRIKGRLGIHRGFFPADSEVLESLIEQGGRIV